MWSWKLRLPELKFRGQRIRNPARSNLAFTVLAFYMYCTCIVHVLYNQHSRPFRTYPAKTLHASNPTQNDSNYDLDDDDANDKRNLSMPAEQSPNQTMPRIAFSWYYQLCYSKPLETLAANVLDRCFGLEHLKSERWPTYQHNTRHSWLQQRSASSRPPPLY